MRVALLCDEDRSAMTVVEQMPQPQTSCSSPKHSRTMYSVFVFLTCTQFALGFAPSPLFARKTLSASQLLAATTEMPEGLVKTVTKPGNGPPLKLGDVATVKYSCYLPDEAPFARSDFQKVVRQ